MLWRVGRRRQGDQRHQCKWSAVCPGAVSGAVRDALSDGDERGVQDGFRPLSIKGDHSDIMYLLNAGWPILFAHTVQQVYDFNIIALRLAEQVRLPVAVAYDGFFTSHQKRRCLRFADDKVVRRFIGPRREVYPFLDLKNPVTVGSYMNEPDLINNRYQLHLAMRQADELIPRLLRSTARSLAGSMAKWKGISGRTRRSFWCCWVLLMRRQKRAWTKCAGTGKRRGR